MPRSSRPYPADTRRSPCPLACGLDLFGDAWTLLVVRDLLFGERRFKELASSPEHIPTNLLSDRLTRLLRHGLVEQVAPASGGKHLAYRLTAKGQSLRPLLAAVRDWALAWQPGTQDFLSLAHDQPS